MQSRGPLWFTSLRRNKSVLLSIWTSYDFTFWANEFTVYAFVCVYVHILVRPSDGGLRGEQCGHTCGCEWHCWSVSVWWWLEVGVASQKSETGSGCGCCGVQGGSRVEHKPKKSMSSWKEQEEECRHAAISNVSALGQPRADLKQDSLVYIKELCLPAALHGHSRVQVYKKASCESESSWWTASNSQQGSWDLFHT